MASRCAFALAAYRPATSAIINDLASLRTRLALFLYPTANHDPFLPFCRSLEAAFADTSNSRVLVPSPRPSLRRCSICSPCRSLRFGFAVLTGDSESLLIVGHPSA